MSAFLGIDVGTSGIKAIIVDELDGVLAEASAPLTISRPRPLWSEQDPADWWQAVEAALDQLAASRERRLADVTAIGLSGQMLGVALFDEADHPLRPALLWNDGRAGRECDELEAAVQGFADIVGCRPMPGFPAPKLRWLHANEPAHLRLAKLILLPKDAIRLKLTGEAVTDEADGSATLLMDTRRAEWEPSLLAAAEVRVDQLPHIARSTAITGYVRQEHALRWGLGRRTPVVGGAGDNMCGAVGAGATRSGQGCIGLGTSGVYVVANDRFLPAQGAGMHTHRHAVPGLFLQNGCILSAGAALSWVAGLVGATDLPAILSEVAEAPAPMAETPVFTPYLAGERTPHDDPGLTATFSGLTLSTTRLHLVQSVLEGVALGIGDCHNAIRSTAADVTEVRLVGGGARSRLLASMIASEIGLPLQVPRAGAYGPALGAARLARAALGGALVAADVIEEVIEPCPALAAQLADKRCPYESHLALRGAREGPVSPAA